MDSKEPIGFIEIVVPKAWGNQDRKWLSVMGFNPVPIHHNQYAGTTEPDLKPTIMYRIDFQEKRYIPGGWGATTTTRAGSSDTARM